MREALDRALPWWKTPDEVRRRAREHMAFNLGFPLSAWFRIPWAGWKAGQLHCCGWGGAGHSVGQVGTGAHIDALGADDSYRSSKWRLMVCGDKTVHSCRCPSDLQDVSRPPAVYRQPTVMPLSSVVGTPFGAGKACLLRRHGDYLRCPVTSADFSFWVPAISTYRRGSTLQGTWR